MATNQKYSFKSVGESAVDKRERLRNLSTVPIGIKTPCEVSSTSDGLLKMNLSIEDQVSDNLRNLIQTNWGERLFFYDFGANLEELAFSLGSSESIDEEAIRRISKSVAKYMPYIDLDTFEPLVEKSASDDVARVGVRIAYSIPEIGVFNKKIEVIIYAVG